MSEVPKTVEEPVAAPSTETPVAEPVVEDKSAEAAPEAPAATEPAAAEETAAVVEEVKPVEEGVLGYKGPGLLKGLIFQKKFFWFGSEPVEQKHLSSYLRGEKPEVGNHNVAWASHTGKGLLFFAKKEAEKATPASVINLADVSDVTSEGTTFFFTDGGHKHTFEAKTIAERDNWVSQLKAKSAEAKELAPSVTEHESYKSTLDKLKPVVAVVAPKKSTEVKKEEKAEVKEEKKEEKAEAKEEKKEEKAEAKEEKKEEKKTARKSRSASRKRNSIFGSIGFGKKEEKVEAPKEETPAVAPTVEAVPEPAATEPAAVEETPAVVEPSAPAVEEAAPAATETSKPANKKRNSVFETFKSFSQPKAKKEEAPAVPAKDTVPEPEPVSEAAPVIPAVESTEPLAASVASPATVPTETAPITNGETKAAETPATKSDKRKSSIPWLTKKEKATTSDEEAEKPKSPFARIRATVKGKPKAEKAEKSTEKPVETTEPATEATEAKPEEPIVSEPIPAAHTSTPTVAATA